jgi:glutathione S-transferase
MYSVLESRLKESPYLAGSKYTILDIANFTWARNGPSVLDIDFSEFPALKKWVNEIEQRAAVQKGGDVPHTGRSDADRDVFIKSMLARIAGMTNTDKD